MMGIKCSELKGTFFRNKNLSADKNEKKIISYSDDSPGLQQK